MGCEENNSFGVKRRADVSLGMIIAMAIGLIAIIIAVAIMGGKTKMFSKSLSDCSAKGGVCIDASESCPAPMPFSCPEGQKCCITPECEGAGLRCASECGPGETRIFMKHCPNGVCCKSG